MPEVAVWEAALVVALEGGVVSVSLQDGALLRLLLQSLELLQAGDACLTLAVLTLTQSPLTSHRNAANSPPQVCVFCIRT